MDMIEAPIAYEHAAMDRQTAEAHHDATRLLRKFRRGLPVICAFVVAGLVSGCLLMRVVKPSYTSSMSILIDPKTPGSYGADAEFANAFVDAAKIASVEVVLLSSKILQHVVTAQHLAGLPYFGDARSSLFKRLLDEPPQADNAQARDTRAVDRLRRMIRTSRVGTTYVIQVDVSAESPAQTQTLAAGLAEAYLGDLEQTRQDMISRDSRWLTDRLGEQRTELIRSEVAIEALRKKYHLVGAEGGLDSSTDRQSVSQINAMLAKAQEDVAASQAAYSQAQEIVRSGGDLAGLPDAVGSKVIQDLRFKQADASRRVADLSMQYTSQYVPLQHAEADRKILDHQVGLEVARIMGSLKYQYNTALVNRDALAKQVNGLIGLVNQGDSAEGRVELREAERVAEANRIAYEASLKRLREVQPQQFRQEPEARIISGPDLPELPSSPKLALFAGTGGLGGLLAGLALMLVLPIGRDRVGDGGAAQGDLLPQVLSITPFLSRKSLSSGGRPLSIPEYVAANPYSAFAEGLKRLRLRLRPFSQGSGQVVQVTSAISREGKSTIAASLAISAAISGVRTVLVDLDLHQPAAGILLDHEHGPGIVDVLLGDTELESVVWTNNKLPVRVINAGRIAGLRPGMIESAQLRNLVGKLSNAYDLVIIDSPPVLSVSDPLYISELANATIMVVAWRATPHNHVDEAARQLRAAGAPLIGIVLNKVNRVQSGSYGATYHDRRYVTS